MYQIYDATNEVSMHVIGPASILLTLYWEVPHMRHFSIKKIFYCANKLLKLL